MKFLYDIVAIKSGNKTLFRTKSAARGVLFRHINVGDFNFPADEMIKRSMLVSRNTVRFETKDHKPTDPHERQRITRHGGYIQMNRVNGNLALSR